MRNRNEYGGDETQILKRANFLLKIYWIYTYSIYIL